MYLDTRPFCSSVSFLVRENGHMRGIRICGVRKCNFDESNVRGGVLIIRILSGDVCGWIYM